MEIFIGTFAVLYALQIIFGILRVAENKGLELSSSDLAIRTVYKFGVFIWAVYLLARG